MERLSRSTSSAIHTAPPEIIIAILENLVALSQSLPLGQKYRYLIRFTHLSSRLRSIAITTPTLWTRIEITGFPATFELAKVCLQRSGAQKLDINISIASRIRIKLPGILALVNYAAIRTERLSLSLVLTRGDGWSETQKALQALVLPSVDDLELALRAVELQEELPTTCLPAQLPQLRSLVLRDVVPTVQPTSLNNLKKLVITSGTQSSWPLGRLQEVFKECQQLEILELIAKPANPEDAVNYTAPREPTRQSLPNLMRLTLKGQSSKFCCQLLQDLDAPELEEVELGFSAERSRELVEWTSTHNPFNSVRLLSVSTDFCSSRIQLQEFLPKAFPNVEELALSVYGWPLLDTFSPVPKGESDGSRSTSCWNELRGLSVADNDGGNGGCDRKCMERLQAVKTFLEARSSRSLPRLNWAQVGSCETITSKAESVSTVEAIQGALDDEGLAFLFTKAGKGNC